MVPDFLAPEHTERLSAAFDALVSRRRQLHAAAARKCRPGERPLAHELPRQATVMARPEVGISQAMAMAWPEVSKSRAVAMAMPASPEASWS